MNILSLVIGLILILSVLTIEKLEKFNHQAIIQITYQNFLNDNERQVFNRRQKQLYRINEKNHRQLSFRFFLDKESRQQNEKAAKQNRLIVLEFLKVAYGHAAFFKAIEKERSNFLEELLQAIEQASENLPEKSIKRIQDIARLKLEDPELQTVLYLMLKGTISWNELKQQENWTPKMKEKGYVSLLSYINFNKDARICIQYASKELLKAIFENEEVVNNILIRRNELAATQNSIAFQNEFKDKRRAGIDETMLDFKISKTNKSEYD